MDKGVVELADARIQADDVYVDGHDINGISTAVIKDRKLMSTSHVFDNKNVMIVKRCGTVHQKNIDVRFQHEILETVIEDDEVGLKIFDILTFSRNFLSIFSVTS